MRIYLCFCIYALCANKFQFHIMSFHIIPFHISLYIYILYHIYVFLDFCITWRERYIYISPCLLICLVLNMLTSNQPRWWNHLWGWSIPLGHRERTTAQWTSEVRRSQLFLGENHGIFVVDMTVVCMGKSSLDVGYSCVLIKLR